MQDQEEQNRTDDYDTPWKTILETYFEDFMAFFLPVAHQGIDWSRGVEFLDKELARIAHDAEIGNRTMDKLVKVWQKNGQERWVLIHAEVQGEWKKDFLSRIYTYQYRAFDIKKMPVVGLIILTDEEPNWRPNEYHQELWGSEVVYRFNTVKLLDYLNRLDELENSDNPFSIVVLAQLQAKKTHNQPEARYQSKWHIIRSLYKRGFSQQQIVNLFHFIDWVLALPEAIDQRFWHELNQFEESQKMPYISSVERIGQKKGILIGRQEGKAEMLLHLIQRRFGMVPEAIHKQVFSANLTNLDIWIDRILDSDSLQAIFEDQNTPH
ncbi:MAG: hypothetical protein HQL94_03225 [Magnetococcales bacterium]|nr:hypothetical protein [Magnetococcales bacterium]